MIAVIVPTARPRMAANILANFERQRLPVGAVLVVVENGPARGTWRHDGHVVQSAHGRSHARTSGLRRARDLGAEYYSFADDDDYYAPGFLEFMWERRHAADVIGLCNWVCETPDGQRHLLHPGAKAGLLAPDFHGALVGGMACQTTLGRVDRALDWTYHGPFAEEQFWYRDMHEAGRTLRGFPEPNPHDPLFVLKRYADSNHGHAIDWQRERRACGGVPIEPTTGAMAP